MVLNKKTVNKKTLEYKKLNLEEVSDSDYLKYGIGIGADYSDIDFDNLEFESGIEISSNIGELYRFDKAAKQQEFEDVINQNLYIAQDQIESNKFFAKNVQEPTDSFFLHISKDTTVEDFAELSIEQKAESSLVYLFIYIEEGVDVQILEKLQANNYLGLVVDVCVADNANCNYAILQNINDGFVMTCRGGVINRDASLNWYDINLGSKKNKTSIVNKLKAEGASSEVSGVFFGSDEQQYDIYNATIHENPHTSSNMLTKGVLDDDAKGVYRGLVKVNKGVANSQGYQKEDTLLLSDDAQINSVPDLEIANNEVTCSHGVTTSRIDSEDLFYLQSRGLDKYDAEEMFVLGHISPVLDKIDSKDLKDDIRGLVLDKMRNL